MPKKSKPPEERTPKGRVCRAVDLAYKAAMRGDDAGVQRWLEEAAKEGYEPNSKQRRDLAFLLEKNRVGPRVDDPPLTR